MFFNIAHAQGSRTLQNPVGGFSSIPDLLNAIVNILMIFAVPIIVFFVIFAGFSYVTAQGNPEKIKTASRSLMYAIIGAVVILGAFAISTIVTSVVCSFSATPTICSGG